MLSGGTTYSVGEAASSVIQNLFDARPEVTKFVNLAAVDALYARDTDAPAAKKGKNHSNIFAQPLCQNAPDMHEKCCGECDSQALAALCAAPMLHVTGDTSCSCNRMAAAVTDETGPHANPFNFDDDKLHEAFLSFPDDLRNVRPASILTTHAEAQHEHELISRP